MHMETFTCDAYNGVDINSRGKKLDQFYIFLRWEDIGRWLRLMTVHVDAHSFDLLELWADFYGAMMVDFSLCFLHSWDYLNMYCIYYQYIQRFFSFWKKDMEWHGQKQRWWSHCALSPGLPHEFKNFWKSAQICPIVKSINKSTLDQQKIRRNLFVNLT